MPLHVRHRKNDAPGLRLMLSLASTVAIGVAVSYIFPTSAAVADRGKTAHSIQVVAYNTSIPEENILGINIEHLQPAPAMTDFLELAITESPPTAEQASILPIDVVPTELPHLPVTELLPAPDELPPDSEAKQAQASPQAPPHPPVEETFTPAQYLSAPQPVYPQEAQRRRISGTVKIRIHINAFGKPTGVDILSSPHPALSESTRQTILTSWHFIAARKGKTSVKSTVITAVIFQL